MYTERGICFVRIKLLFLMLLSLFSFSFPAFSQQEMVRMVYFYPRDRQIDQVAVQKRMDGLAEILVSFYKGLVFEKSNNAHVIHVVQGDREAGDYILADAQPEDLILAEIREKKGFDLSKDLYLVVTNVDSPEDICGIGGIVKYPNLGERVNVRMPTEVAWAFVYERSDCVPELLYYLAAHELGHALGLGHDFRHRNYVMSYGVEKVIYPHDVTIWRTPYDLSDCAKEWLKASRFFSLDPSLSRSTAPGIIELSSSPTYDPDTKELRLSFTGSGVPSIHQVQLHLIEKNVPDGYYPKDVTRDSGWNNLNDKDKLSLHSCHAFQDRQDHKNQIVFKNVNLSNTPVDNMVEILWIDTHGNITSRELSSTSIEFKNTRAAVGILPTESLPADAVQDSRLRATLTGHTGFVSSVDFSPNGRTLASGSWDRTIRLWNADTAESSIILTDHTDRVTSVTFSPNGNMLASGSWDKTVRFWNPHSGKLLRSTSTPRVIHETFTSVVAADAHGDSYWFASGSLDDHVWLWYGYGLTPRSEYYKLPGHTHDVSSVAFSADERTLASGSRDHTVKLWDIYDQKLRATLKGHTGFVTSVAFSPDGRTLASGSWDNTLILWDVAAEKSIKILRGHTDRVLTVAFSPDGRTLASGSDDQTVRLWDVATGQQRDTLLGHTSGVSAVAFSPDRKTLASAGGGDNTVKLWDLSPAPTSAPVVRITPSPVISPAFGGNLVIKVDISGVQNIAGYQMTVHFDPTALRYVNSANRTYLPAGALFVPPVVNANQVTLAATALSGNGDGAGTLASLTFEVVAVKPSSITLSDVMIMKKDLTSIPIIVKGTNVVVSSAEALDVNGDSVIDLQDLTIVATHFGVVGENPADVNRDGIVNIKDILLVAGGVNAEAAAPSAYPLTSSMLTATDVQMWLGQAQQLNLSSATYERGILVLKLLMESLTPKETMLLPNYPNPFNPETWIPYQIETDSNVSITIYNIKGMLVRTLPLGYQLAGYYMNRERAAYWDGRNAHRERVASGVYFYTLTAGDFTATRRMLILK